MEFVVNRDAFGMPKAADTEENNRVQKDIWSKEWVGLYCKAALPPQQIQDLRCGIIERRYKYCTNPTQLMENIPQLVPIAIKALQRTSEP